MAEVMVDDIEERRDTARLDLAPLRYVLLHRSRMNVLDLNRQIEMWRGVDNRLRLEPGAVRSERRFRIDVTFQLAVELQLAEDRASQWVGDSAQRRQLLIDAVYYPSVQWSLGEPPAVLDSRFETYLIKRLRLDEVAPLDAPRPGKDAPRETTLGRLRDAYSKEIVDRELVGPDTLHLLRGMVAAVVQSERTPR